jgi:dihydrolipoamide dehydrogenase
VSHSFEMIVVGSGPGGYVAAIRASQLGMRTAIIERDGPGGRCLRHACMPAKAVLRAADAVDGVRQAGAVGVQAAPPRVDFPEVAAYRDKVVSRLTDGVRRLLANHDVHFIPGEARLLAPGVLGVDGQELKARHIVLATGSVARSLPGSPRGDRVITTEQAWALSELPDRLVVVGAGPSGVEIASAYARLGSDVLLLEASGSVLPTEDSDVSAIVHRGLRGQGVEIRASVTVDRVASAATEVIVEYADETVRADRLVLAVGRGPDVEGLGLDVAGVGLGESGLIDVDDAMRTTAPGVFAIGDLVSGPALAHKASEEGIIAVEAAAGLGTEPLRHEDIPRATFCSPNVASVGLTEQQARERGSDVVVGKVSYGAVGAGAIHHDGPGLVKIVGDPFTGEILGAHVAGARSTELIHELVATRALEGGYPEVARSVHAHPTLSEVVLEAARDADGWAIHR